MAVAPLKPVEQRLRTYTQPRLPKRPRCVTLTLFTILLLATCGRCNPGLAAGPCLHQRAGQGLAAEGAAAGRRTACTPPAAAPRGKCQIFTPPLSHPLLLQVGMRQGAGRSLLSSKERGPRLTCVASWAAATPPMPVWSASALIDRTMVAQTKPLGCCLLAAATLLLLGTLARCQDETRSNWTPFRCGRGGVQEGLALR